VNDGGDLHLVAMGHSRCGAAPGSHRRCGLLAAHVWA